MARTPAAASPEAAARPSGCRVPEAAPRRGRAEAGERRPAGQPEPVAAVGARHWEPLRARRQGDASARRPGAYRGRVGREPVPVWQAMSGPARPAAGLVRPAEPRRRGEPTAPWSLAVPEPVEASAEVAAVAVGIETARGAAMAERLRAAARRVPARFARPGGRPAGEEPAAPRLAPSVPPQVEARREEAQQAVRERRGAWPRVARAAALQQEARAEPDAAAARRVEELAAEERTGAAAVRRRHDPDHPEAEHPHPAGRAALRVGPVRGAAAPSLCPRVCLLPGRLAPTGSWPSHRASPRHALDTKPTGRGSTRWSST